MTGLDLIRLGAFVIVTIVFVVISRKALLNYRSHGFYRFFAWEAIVALIILNLPYWFGDPLLVTQLLSWVLLFSSLFVLWQGVSLLRSTKQAATRTDKELYGFEKTSRVVTSGIYGYIRHPLYASLLYLAWGAFLKNPAWVPALLAMAASIFLLATAKADERECIEYFGEEYENYMKGTKRFVPFIF